MILQCGSHSRAFRGFNRVGKGTQDLSWHLAE
jgi:hypothetical protein